MVSVRLEKHCRASDLRARRHRDDKVYSSRYVSRDALASGARTEEPSSRLLLRCTVCAGFGRGGVHRRR